MAETASKIARKRVMLKLSGEALMGEDAYGSIAPRSSAS